MESNVRNFFKHSVFRKKKRKANVYQQPVDTMVDFPNVSMQSLYAVLLL